MLAILPLSPVREWATSRNFMNSNLLVDYLKLNVIRWNKNGCDSNYLSDMHPHSPSSCRTIGIEGFHLVANVYRIRACGCSRCDAKANFWEILPVFGDRLGKCIFVQRIDADVIDAQFLDRHTQHGEPLLDNFSRQLCSQVRPRPTIADFPLDEEAVSVANAGFIVSTPVVSPSSTHLNLVVSDLVHHDLGKFGNH